VKGMLSAAVAAAVAAVALSTRALLKKDDSRRYAKRASLRSIYLLSISVLYR